MEYGKTRSLLAEWREPIAVDMMIEKRYGEHIIENVAGRTSGVYYGMENIAWSNGAT